MNVLCSLQMASDIPDGKTRQEAFIYPRSETSIPNSNAIFHRRSLLRYGLHSNACRNIWMYATRIYPIDAKISRHIGFNNDEFRKETQKETIL